MIQYRITTRLRPIRIGMLSGLTSSDSFVRCVELSTALWAARYNPILPALASTSDWNESALRGPMTPDEVLARWMCNFDADIFARMEDAAPAINPRAPEAMRGMFDTVLKWQTVLGANNGTHKYGVGYGVGLLELAHDFITHEASFVRQPPVLIVSPSIVGHPALSAALFGTLDSFLAVRYHDLLAVAGHKTVEIDVQQ
jgi:hypothetical protein